MGYLPMLRLLSRRSNSLWSRRGRERFIVFPQRGHSSGSTAQVRKTRAAQRLDLPPDGPAGIPSSDSVRGVGLSLLKALAKWPA